MFAKDSKQTPKNILLVEDDPHWQKVMSAILRSIDANFQVHCVRTVGDAEQALFFEPTCYDLIIADYALAGALDGVDLWSTCRRNYRRVPFFLISGCDNELLNRRIQEEFPDAKLETRAPTILAKKLGPKSLQSQLLDRLPHPSAKE